jgi:SAM-dependent MidA family methyltransferase
MIETSSTTESLAQRLRERIKREGPISFSDWMAAALYDPDDGYYCRVDLPKWGREGDYRTSPERTSLFAATFARYFAGLHEQLGSPLAWSILEAGAGGGTFAQGALQTLRDSFPKVFAATTFVIDEVSPTSRRVVQERLQSFGDRVQLKTVDELKISAGIVFANELLDAFPVHRVKLHEGVLKEFKVTLGDDESFEWLLSAPDAALSSKLENYFNDAGIKPREGQVVEVNLQIEEWLGRVAESIDSGYVIVVDYGAESESLYSSMNNQTGTLRGFRRHQFVDDLLADPGGHDLTTTVNWTVVKSVATRLGFEVVEFERQDQFLLQAGFLEQLETESGAAGSEAEGLRLSTAAREMILPDGMAASFQVLVLKKSALQTYGG